MDATRFDALARTLTGSSRRGVLGGLLLGGTVGLAGLTQAEAKKKHKKRRKTKCAPPTIKCGNACFDPSTDPANCGRCGNACAASQVCTGGTCVTGIGTCAAGTNVCLNPLAGNCNGDPECFCLLAQGGATRCARYSDQPSLRLCEADADCADRGAGAFCPRYSNSCGGICAIPC